MLILQKGNRNTKSLAYTLLEGPILEYGAACWDSYREDQISGSDRLQKKAAKFACHTVWETFEDSSHLRPLQSIHWKTGMEAYKGQITRNMLP